LLLQAQVAVAVVTVQIRVVPVVVPQGAMQQTVARNIAAQAGARQLPAPQAHIVVMEHQVLAPPVLEVWQVLIQQTFPALQVAVEVAAGLAVVAVAGAAVVAALHIQIQHWEAVWFIRRAITLQAMARSLSLYCAMHRVLL
jgi:hypothetical protein